mgnify:CR=1 FL=1
MTTLDEKSIYGPVTNWQTDFDHADPSYNENAHEIWSELRGTCPVAHTERYGNTWLPVTHEYVHEIAYDTEHFSSRGVVVATVKPSDLPDAIPAHDTYAIALVEIVGEVAQHLLIPETERYIPQL